MAFQALVQLSTPCVSPNELVKNKETIVFSPS